MGINRTHRCVCSRGRFRPLDNYRTILLGAVLGNWFYSFSPNPNPRVRLFCFPYGGGGASVFREWHECLPKDIEPMCAQLPGRESRFNESPISDLDEACGKLAQAMEPYLDKPFLFFGHSLGGLISYHLASLLMSQGRATPSHIIVAGRSAPDDKEQYYDRIAHLPDEQFLERLPEYGGTPESLLNNKELMSIYLPALRSDFQLSEFDPKSEQKLTCPISVFGGERDRMTRDNLQLWSHETSRTCTVTMFPGNHFFLTQNKAQVLAEVTKIARRVIPD